MAEDVDMEVVPYSERPDYIPLDYNDWPLTLRIEVAAIENTREVVPGSISVFKTVEGVTPNAYLVVLMLQRGRCGDATVADIRVNEPIALYYVANTVNTSAPKIFSERADFPRDLPHLNPVAATNPVFPCLAREGINTLYKRVGIQGFLARASRWMFDAAYGLLDKDGWEPVIMYRFQDAVLDVSELQTLAAAPDGKLGGIATGIATTNRLPNNDDPVYYTKIYPFPFEQEPLAEIFDSEPSPWNIPWAFVWGNHDNVSAQYCHPSISTFEELSIWAENGGCHENLREAIDQQLAKLPNLAELAVILVGHWRPRPLRPSIPDLADGWGAHLEITVFLIGFNRHEDGSWDCRSISNVWPLRLVSNASPALMKKMAGISEKFSSCGIVGCGALGSYVAEHLVREGVNDLMLVDYDIFAPHNVARHVLSKTDYGLLKAGALAKRLANLTGVKVKSEDAVIQSVIADKESAFSQIEFILDTTANPALPHYWVNVCESRPILRASIANEGRLGLLVIEGLDKNPRIDDLQVWLYALADQHEPLVSWLRDNNSIQSVTLGLNCASETMVVSSSSVGAHASVIARRVRDYLTNKNREPGILVNAMDADGMPTGARWFAAPGINSVQAQVIGHEHVWELRLPDTEQAKIDHWVTNSHDEQGGYLYGLYDLRNQVINVARVVHVPTLKSTPGGLHLPPAGRTAEERRLNAASSGKLLVVGSWHTHPEGGAGMSFTDLIEAARISMANTRTPRPFALFIGAPGEFSTHIVYPLTWLNVNSTTLSVSEI